MVNISNDLDNKLFVISIIIPVRNEELFIEKCLTSLFEGTYPSDMLEVFVLDGCSSDKTVQIAQDLADSKGWNIKVINNPGKTQPYAMNIGITLATGKYIARADAHSEYQSDYIETLAKYMGVYPEIDNVGGMWDVLPSKACVVSNAIALAYSHKFATGAALYRTGIDKPSYVDTVPFGFYRREVFDKYGLYDVELPRNEDQELNHRIIAGGGKVLLVPDVVTAYYARPTLFSMAKMFFQYGWFKPLSQFKQKGVFAFRQFVPLFSLLLLLFLSILAVITEKPLFVWSIFTLIALYLSMSCISSIEAVRKKKQSVLLVPLVCVVFFVIHASFLIGNIKGIVDFLILKKRISDIPLTR